MKDYANSDLPRGKSGLTSDDTFDSESKEYKLSTAVAGWLRENTNNTLGDLLTMLEFSLPKEQAEAGKALVKQALWALSDKNQHVVYYAFGIEPKQLGDYDYIQSVLDGTDGKALEGNN